MGDASPAVGSVDFVGCVPELPETNLTTITMLDSIAPLEAYDVREVEDADCTSAARPADPANQTQVNGIVVDATVSADERVHRLDNRCNWKLDCHQFQHHLHGHRLGLGGRQH